MKYGEAEVYNIQGNEDTQLESRSRHCLDLIFSECLCKQRWICCERHRGGSVILSLLLALFSSTQRDAVLFFFLANYKAPEAIPTVEQTNREIKREG